MPLLPLEGRESALGDFCSLFSTFSSVMYLLLRLPINVFLMAIGYDVSFFSMVLGTDIDWSIMFYLAMISSVGSRICGS